MILRTHFQRFTGEETVKWFFLPVDEFAVQEEKTAYASFQIREIIYLLKRVLSLLSDLSRGNRF